MLWKKTIVAWSVSSLCYSDLTWAASPCCIFILFLFHFYTHSTNIDWEGGVLLALSPVQSWTQALCFPVAKLSFSRAKEQLFLFFCSASHKDGLLKLSQALLLWPAFARSPESWGTSPWMPPAHTPWGGLALCCLTCLPLSSCSSPYAQEASGLWNLPAGLLPLEPLSIVVWQEQRLWSQGNLGFAWNSNMN